jgi:hypothetical protein
VAVASLVAEAAAWQKGNFDGSSSALGRAAEARQRRRQCGFGGGSVASVEAAAARQAARRWRQGRGGMCLPFIENIFYPHFLVFLGKFRM